MLSKGSTCVLLIFTLGIGAAHSHRPGSLPPTSKAGFAAKAPQYVGIISASAPDTSVVQPFDASKAWGEFNELLRMHYGYFQRPGVDGDVILRYFELQAKAAKTKEGFRNVLQLVAHNFADPHFVVGPLDTADYSVFPTSSDLYARYQAKQFTIVDVRRASDAEQQGILPGAKIVTIDGQTPTAAVEKVMGRPIATLSPQQIDAGLNTALAGIRRRPRLLTLQAGSAVKRKYTLRPTAELALQVRASPPVSVERRGEVSIIRINNSLGNNETIPAFKAALQSALNAKLLVLDFRNTPSGGNTTVARSIMGHFVQREHPYQVHVVPSEERLFGVPRKFVEYVLPIAPYYPGRVVVLGGHWTGSMGEGLMIGFDAIGAKTAGSGLADLLGALFNERLPLSDAEVDLGEEQLLHVNGTPREAFVPSIFLEASEGHADHDFLLEQAIAAVR